MKGSLDEAFGLSIGLGCIWPDSDVLETISAAYVRECLGGIIARPLSVMTRSTQRATTFGVTP